MQSGRRILHIIVLIMLTSPVLEAKEAHFGEIFIAPKPKRMTFEGSNRQPLYISNDTFVFVSKNRKSHRDPQLYFKDMNKGKEKRITHQRGQLSNGGLYVGKEGKIIYSSTTDEEKEAPYSLKKSLERYPSSVKNDSFFHVDFPAQEIYQSEVDGSEVLRLTEYSGYDGFPTYLSTKERLYFSRWDGKQIRLYAKSISKNLAPWRVTQTSGHDLGLKLSPDEKSFVWSRFSPDFRSSQVLISDLNFKSPRYLTLDSGVNWSPSWHPNGNSVIYSARNSASPNYDLFEVAVKGECQRKITSYQGDEFFPTVSPDGKNILFTSTKSGVEQVYKIAYPGPLNCN